MTVETFDALIIGAGQAGVPLAVALSKSGKKTAVIEREHVGGTCINEGCTPTKTMIASGRVAYLSSRGAEYGVEHYPDRIDMTAIRKRKRDIVSDFRAGGERRLSSNGVELISGEGSFTGKKTLEVRLNHGGVRELEAGLIVIDTGARPANPPLPGLDSVPVLDSTSIMELGEVPEHLLVIGGGYIGVEFGQLFRRLGSKVTVFQRGGRLLAREDADVADEVASILREDGVELLLDSEPVSVKQVADDKIQLTYKLGGKEHIRTGSHLLVAAGRSPNTGALNLDRAGIELNKRGFIPVNRFLMTVVDGIYATGDVNGGPAFTHISYDDYRIIEAGVLGKGGRTTSDRPVPYTVFMDPQLGRIGISELEAKEQGLKVKVAKIPMSYVTRAIEMGETRGFMKAIVDAESSRILGAVVLGIEGGELMAMLQIAMMGKIKYQDLRDAVFAHPTLAKSLNTLFMSLDG